MEHTPTLLQSQTTTRSTVNLARRVTSVTLELLLKLRASALRDSLAMPKTSPWELTKESHALLVWHLRMALLDKVTWLLAAKYALTDHTVLVVLWLAPLALRDTYAQLERSTLLSIPVLQELLTLICQNGIIKTPLTVFLVLTANGACGEPLLLSLAHLATLVIRLLLVTWLLILKRALLDNSVRLWELPQAVVQLALTTTTALQDPVTLRSVLLVQLEPVRLQFTCGTVKTPV